MAETGEARVVVDAGHELELTTVTEAHAAHHVHLPELHGLGALPAAVVLAPSAALLGIDQAMAYQAAVDRGARGIVPWAPPGPGSGRSCAAPNGGGRGAARRCAPRAAGGVLCGQRAGRGEASARPPMPLRAYFCSQRCSVWRLTP